MKAGGAFRLIVMSWITFTAEHVRARCTSREIETYEAIAAVSQDNPDGSPAPDGSRIDSIVEQVCNRFRGAIRSNPQVTAMGATGTLPDFCIFDAATLAKSALIALNPVPEGMTDPRREEIRSAEKMLESLRTMKGSAFSLDEPSSEDVSNPSYGGGDLLDF